MTETMYKQGPQIRKEIKKAFSKEEVAPIITDDATEKFTLNKLVTIAKEKIKDLTKKGEIPKMTVTPGNVKDVETLYGSLEYRGTLDKLADSMQNWNLPSLANKDESVTSTDDEGNEVTTTVSTDQKKAETMDKMNVAAVATPEVKQLLHDNARRTVDLVSRYAFSRDLDALATLSNSSWLVSLYILRYGNKFTQHVPDVMALYKIAKINCLTVLKGYRLLTADSIPFWKGKAVNKFWKRNVNVSFFTSKIALPFKLVWTGIETITKSGLTFFFFEILDLLHTVLMEMWDDRIIDIDLVYANVVLDLKPLTMNLDKESEEYKYYDWLLEKFWNAMNDDVNFKTFGFGSDRLY